MAERLDKGDRESDLARDGPGVGAGGSARKIPPLMVIGRGLWSSAMGSVRMALFDISCNSSWPMAMEVTYLTSRNSSQSR